MAIHNPISVPDSEYTFTAIRASGPGGQHVNKVATAVLLRFDIAASSLSEEVKERLLASADNHITAEGEILIKAQNARSQLKNKEEAVQRLHDLVNKYALPKKKRKRTRPTRAAREKRLEEKTRKGEIKALRKKPLS